MYNRGNIKRHAFGTRGRSVQSFDVLGPQADQRANGENRLFLQIKPAFSDAKNAITQRSHSTLSSNYDSGDGKETNDLRAVGEGKVQISRTPQEKDRLPDRISLDRRGLSSIPYIVGEPSLRLLSLQHNLINSLTGLAPLDLGQLVFLDVYDNQIDKITSLDRLFSLRVLLMGKNRIRRIDGLSNLLRLEVLDLHGNRIAKVSGLANLAELKVLNLAGNQIKTLGFGDLQGLVSLRELNLKRNRLRKLLGFQHTPNLQKVYLGNNDLQSVEDVASLSEATNLIEISLDGNPVALGGDCTPFLVSYLPNLVTLTSMHVTEQVRNAAMAWRSNKDAAHAAYCALGGVAQQEARRDQIINNARTNWELLRSENKCFTTMSTLKITEIDTDLAPKPQTTTQNGSTQTFAAALPDVVVSVQQNETEDLRSSTSNVNLKSSHSESNLKSSSVRKLQRSVTAKKISERRVNFSDRSASQETDGSHSTTTSSDLRLPPILIPIISSLENVKLSDSNEPVLKRWGSISSVEPIVDSSFSSLPSSSSDSEGEMNKRNLRRAPTASRRRVFSSVRSKSVCDPESRRSKPKDYGENTSNISSNTNACSNITSSTSGSDQNTKILKREGSLNSRITRNSRSATVSRRNEKSLSTTRASTARAKSVRNMALLKSTESIPKTVPQSKDREQGVDYLVEVNEGVVSAWGAGAVRRLARDWEWEKARTVTKAAFHYVHFNAVAQCLPELKNKFPNVTHISFRATGLQWLGQLHALAELRGLTGLTILPEGNPIHTKVWREYAIYRLGHWGLKEINDDPITDAELKVANETYQGLSDMVLLALPDAPLQPLLSRLGRSSNANTNAKAWLKGADPALRDVIAKEALQYKKGNISQEDENWRIRGRAYLSNAIEMACGAAQRLKLLEVEWPSILVDIIEETLTDFQNMDCHVKEIMQSLIETLDPDELNT